MRADPLIGIQIDGFFIEERLGRGGMAVVYRARQAAMNRDVALKVIDLNSEAVEGQHFHERFAQEAAVIASLEHIHILPVYDFGIYENFAYLAMRLLRGGTLTRLIRKESLALDHAVTLFCEVARGLAYAHSKGVIHRDLKPSNIMLDDAGHALLTDFGLAKIVHGDSEGHDLTQSGSIVGTPAYMSPEQLRGLPIDHRSDIYSMGVILYQMLTGAPPFDAATSDVFAIIYKHLEEIPAPIRSKNPAVSAAIEAVVLQALAKDPIDRFDSVGAMANSLVEATGLSLGVSTEYPTPRIPSGVLKPRDIPRPKRRFSPLYAFLGVAGLALVAALAILVFGVGGGADFVNATVLVGQAGTIDDTVPSENEIATAQRRVGADGFIAFVACNRTSEYHAGYARELVDFFHAYGLSLEIYDSDTKEAQQIPLIEQARSDGAAGLVICSLNFDLLASTLQSIQDAGIPLVLTQSDENNYGGVAMGGDDYLLGLKPGQYAGQLIRDELSGQADVIILDYPDLPQIVRRADGIEDGVMEMAPQAHIIGRYLGGTADLAYESVEQLLADGVTFDVIVSINDAGSFGAIDALADAGYDPDEVIVVSVDAEELAKQYIRAGYFMRGSVALDRAQQTRAVANSMVKLLAGGTIPEVILIAPGDMVTRETLMAERIRE